MMVVAMPVSDASSLNPGLDVKLLTVIVVGPTVLSVVAGGAVHRGSGLTLQGWPNHGCILADALDGPAGQSR